LIQSGDFGTVEHLNQHEELKKQERPSSKKSDMSQVQWDKQSSEDKVPNSPIPRNPIASQNLLFRRV